MRSLASWVVSVVVISALSSSTRADGLAVYVGTYTGSGSQGIYRFDFDTSTGKPSGLELVAETSNPSFLAFAPMGSICTQ